MLGVNFLRTLFLLPIFHGDIPSPGCYTGSQIHQFASGQNCTVTFQFDLADVWSTNFVINELNCEGWFGHCQGFACYLLLNTFFFVFSFTRKEWLIVDLCHICFSNWRPLCCIARCSDPECAFSVLEFTKLSCSSRPGVFKQKLYWRPLKKALNKQVCNRFGDV